MNKDNPQWVINRFYSEVINQQKLDLIDQLVSENFIEHVPFPGQGPGRQGLKDVISMMHAAFPDLNWQIEEQIVEGNKVVSRFRWKGTHRGIFLGIPPTGRSVCVWGVVIDEVSQGKFSASRIITDIPGLLNQLNSNL